MKLKVRALIDPFETFLDLAVADEHWLGWRFLVAGDGVVSISKAKSNVNKPFLNLTLNLSRTKFKKNQETSCLFHAIKSLDLDKTQKM